MGNTPCCDQEESPDFKEPIKSANPPKPSSQPFDPFKEERTSQLHEQVYRKKASSELKEQESTSSIHQKNQPDTPM